MGLRLYDYWRSSAAYRVRIALALKGVAYDSVPVNIFPGHDEQLLPEYLERNPQGRVPVLETDQGLLTQSLAIIVWIDDAYPGPALMPVDPWLRAKARAFGLAIACDIHPMNNLGVQRQLKAQFGADAEAVAAWGRHWIGGGLDALEASLAKEPVHPFAFGETPSVADICLVPQLANARRAGLEVETWPRLAAVDRVARAHPAFFAAAPENHPHAPKD